LEGVFEKINKPMPNEKVPKKDQSVAASEKSKLPCIKPAFEHERVFETTALACGKLSSTQAQCRFNRKTS
jgi:hypothetical protein